MTSYLVRIYRRANNNPRLLVGVAEEVGVHEKKAFSNLYELWDILNPVKRTKRAPKTNTNSRRNKNHARQESLPAGPGPARLIDRGRGRQVRG